MAALLLAPWVGAALAFVLTFALVVVPLALPFTLVSGRKPTERPEAHRPMAPRGLGFARRHAHAH